MTQAEPTPVQRFAGNLRRVREESGLSQAEVADRSGMHASTISAMERALHTPRLDSILRLSSALDVDPATLLSGMCWSPSRRQFVVSQDRTETAAEERGDR